MVLRALVVHLTLALSACATATGPGGISPVRGTGLAAPVVLKAGPRPAAAVVRTAGAPPAELHVRCEHRDSCPVSIGMLVVQAGLEPERCTATLIAPDVMLTAGHCLDGETTSAGASCRGSWIEFPAAQDRPLEWVECAEVIRSRPPDDAGALQQEYALIRLARKLERPVMELDTTPIEDGTIVSVASITPHRIYETQHRLDMRLCRVIGPEAAEPVLGPRARDVGWLSDCPIEPGNSGSPVIDHDGRVRALVHGGTAPFFGFGVTSRVPEP